MQKHLSENFLIDKSYYFVISRSSTIVIDGSYDGFGKQFLVSYRLLFHKPLAILMS